MRRREFIIVVGGTAVDWPLRALAQTPAQDYRVGLLNPGGLDAGPFEKPSSAASPSMATWPIKIW